MPNQELLGMKSERSDYVLFDAKHKGKLIELSPDGGKNTFTENNFPKNIAQQMHKQFKQGKAFIQLSSGKELTATFSLINPDDIR